MGLQHRPPWGGACSDSTPSALHPFPNSPQQGAALSSSQGLTGSWCFHPLSDAFTASPTSSSTASGTFHLTATLGLMCKTVAWERVFPVHLGSHHPGNEPPSADLAPSPLTPIQGQNAPAMTPLEPDSFPPSPPGQLSFHTWLIRRRICPQTLGLGSPTRWKVWPGFEGVTCCGWGCPPPFFILP